MPTAIEGFTPTQVGTPKAKSFNDMSGEDFIKIMITQLQQQDPLDPSKSDQLLTQLSQIKSLESNEALTKNLNGLTLQQSIGAGANMIGKTINGIDEGGDNIEGTVTSIRVEDKKVYLELDTGKKLPIENVVTIANTTPNANTAAATQANLAELARLASLAGAN